MNREKHRGRKSDESETAKAHVDQILLITQRRSIQYLAVSCNAVLSCTAACRWEREREGG